MTAIAAAPIANAGAIAEADAWCRTYARAHDENFTVMSWFLPREMRLHLAALYAFCRWTDDLGDEAEGDRSLLLDDWERELRDCFDTRRSEPLFIALGRTVDACAIPIEPFLRLIEANRMDQRISAYDTYDDLLRYCELSAAPVGSMVLHALGYHDEQRHKLAAATCIALQLANFWQDVSVDLAKGRIYIPAADMRASGYSEADLRAGVVNGAFRDVMRSEVARARELLAQGRALEPLIDRRARTDIRLFRLGGQAVLDAIERANYDVLSRRPRASKMKKARMALTNGLRIKLGL